MPSPKALPFAAEAFAEATGAAKRPSVDIELVPAVEFLAGFKPHRDIIKGLIRGEFVYALTAPTNGGKTAVFVYIALSVCLGMRCAGHETRPGRVLMLVGENPYDVKPRILAACAKAGLEPGDLADRLYIMPQAFSMVDTYHRVRELAEQVGEFSLVLVDTSAAYYGGTSEDDNVEAKQHALALRALTGIPGNPAVIVACHPTKHATREQLEPRGGSSFLNEIDGNLVCFNQDSLVTLHWQRKLRQPAFDPINFRLEMLRLEGVHYEDGSEFFTVVAVPVDETEADAMERRSEEEENRVLYEMHRNPNGGIRAWADGAGMSRWKVEQALRGLAEAKLIRKHRRQWVLTAAGEQEAARIR